MNLLEKRRHYWGDFFKEHPEKLESIKYPQEEDISHLLPYEIDEELLKSLLEEEREEE